MAKNLKTSKSVDTICGYATKAMFMMYDIPSQRVTIGAEVLAQDVSLWHESNGDSIRGRMPPLQTFVVTSTD